MNFDYLFVFILSYLLQLLIYWALQFQLQKNDSESFSFISLAKDLFMIQSLIHPIAFFVILNGPLSILMNLLLAQFFLVFSAGSLMNLVHGRKILSGRYYLISFVAQLTSWQLAPLLSFIFLRN